MDNKKLTEMTQSEKSINSPAEEMRSENNMDNQSLEKIRSRVRRRVTYAMTIVYSITAPGITAWLLWKGEIETAVAVFSGIASTTTGIIAFWFGNRQAPK